MRVALDSLDLCSYLDVLDGRKVLVSRCSTTGLEVYDQLLPNGLADPLGMELLEL